MTDDKWNFAVIARLKTLHSEKTSTKEIARILSDETGQMFTRSGVAGKISRLGLRLRQQRPSMKLRVIPPRAEPRLSAPRYTGPAVPLLQLKEASCRWPVAEEDGQHLFCGQDAVGTYCRTHARIAYHGR
jgi:hypothetical protein